MNPEMLQNVLNLLIDVENDRTVPRNIRSAVTKAKEDLKNEKLEPAVRINSAISTLDEVSNDTNIPSYSRTQIWNIVSVLEIMNKSLKKD
ncbi:MAG: UPF0147 family protein [Candidatus Aenigmatarchaeota archaeon]